MSKKLSRLLEQTRSARLLAWKKLTITYLGNEVDADDAIQDACQRVLSADPPLDTETEMHNYMRTAIKTSALKLLENRTRLVSGEGAPDKDIGSSEADPRPNALGLLIRSEEAAKKERMAAVASQLIGDLPASERQLVESLLLRDPPLKFREVSALEDIPVSTVHYRFKTILAKLAEGILSRSQDEEPEPGLNLVREGNHE